MGCGQDGEDWNPSDTKFEAEIKRKASDHLKYSPLPIEPGGLDHLSAGDVVLFMPSFGDFPQKKQKLDRWESPFEEGSVAPNGRAGVDEAPIQYDEYSESASDNPSYPKSSRSNSLFSPPSSRSTASSRSSSLARSFEAKRGPEYDLREGHCPSIIPEQQLQDISHLTATQARQVVEQDALTPLSLDDETLTVCTYMQVDRAAGRAPLTSINGNHSKPGGFGVTKAPPEDDNMDRSSFTTSASSCASPPQASSLPETDGQSNEGDGSSQSRHSSPVSDSPPNDSGPTAKHDNKLEALIKNNVLRADPAVADLFYQAVKDQLEYSTPEYTEKVEGSHEFSLLDLLELEAFDLVEHSRVVTECAASSAEPSSGSSPAQHGTPASASGQSQNIGGGLAGSLPINSESRAEEGPAQLVQTVAKPGPSPARPQLLRCIHNAIAPAIFSVNPDYLEKFRACAGPGWNNIQHVKEHMQNLHTKKVKKLGPLQCSRCQEEFPDPDDLRGHELNVDCPIRCPDCPDEFLTKALRQDHQKQSHLEQESDPVLIEIDEVMWKQVKDNLKAYTDSLKSKKGKTSSDPNSERERWVVANTARYETGRSKTKVNSKLELGQWYTIFTTLAPNVKILDHPFYDYGTPHSDYAEERILFIHDRMVDARIQAHGVPPSNFDLQREWYREALRDSLRVAAQSKKVSHIKGKASSRQTSTLVPSPGPVPSTGSTRGLSYNGPITATPNVPQAPDMRSNLASIPMQHSFQPAAPPPQQPQQPIQNQWNIDSTISGGMGMDNSLSFLFESPNTMTDNTGQHYTPELYLFGQNDQSTFDLGSDSFTPDWQRHPGGN